MDNFLSDLPRLPSIAQPEPQTFRARLLESELEAATQQARVLREALRQVLVEVRPTANERPFDGDSHLPAHLVAAIERALTLGSLR